MWSKVTAHVFTGWYWYQTGTPSGGYAPSNFGRAMMAFPDHHELAPNASQRKRRTSGQTQEQDLKAALD